LTELKVALGPLVGKLGVYSLTVINFASPLTSYR
jgi:hypothetical protein